MNMLFQTRVHMSQPYHNIIIVGTSHTGFLSHFISIYNNISIAVPVTLVFYPLYSIYNKISIAVPVTLVYHSLFISIDKSSQKIDRMCARSSSQKTKKQPQKIPNTSQYVDTSKVI